MNVRKNLIGLIVISILVCVLLSSCASTTSPPSSASPSSTEVSTQSSPSSESTIINGDSMSIAELTTLVHTTIPTANVTDIVECRDYLSAEVITQTERFYTITNSLSAYELYIANDTELYNRLISANDENKIGEVGYLILCDGSQSPSYYFDCESNCLFYTSSLAGADNDSWTSYRVWVYKDEEINSEYISIIQDAEMEHLQTLADIANAEYSISAWITEFDSEYEYLLLSGTASRADGTDTYSGDIRLDFDAADIDAIGALAIGNKIDLKAFSNADEGGSSDGYWFDYRYFNTENESSLGRKRIDIEDKKDLLSRWLEFITGDKVSETTSESAAQSDVTAVLMAYTQLLTSHENFGSDTFAQYSLYDINSDGTTEIIILSGTCEADAMLQIYSYTDGNPVFIGDISGSHCSLCGKTEGVGLTVHYGHMGSERICDVTLGSGGLIVDEIVPWREVQEYTEFDYCKPIERFSINDFSGLK